MSESESTEICYFDVLPNEALTQIFLCLKRTERLNCKLVCSRWLDILLTDPYFRQDRHCHLNYCLLDNRCEPVSLFLAAPACHYESLKIGEVQMSGDLGRFWTVISSDLKELDISEIENAEQVYEILAFTFPCLKVLYFNYRLWVEDMLLKAENVEDLYLDHFCNTTLAFEKLVQKLPRLKRIYIRSIDYFEGLYFSRIKRDAAKIKDLGKNFFQYGVEGSIWKSQWEQTDDVGTDAKTNLFDILVLEDLKLERLHYKVLEFEGFDDLSFILTVQSGLKEISLSCNAFPPSFFTQITELTVAFYFDITSFEALIPLVNLKRLEISLSDMYDDNELSPCFFGHVALPSRKMKIIDIRTGGEKNCVECWKALCMSYTNLESFSLCNYGYENVVIGLIFDHMEFLSELHLTRQHGNLHRKAKTHKKGMPKYIYNEVRDFLIEWKPMVNLERITLDRVTQVTVIGVKNFCRTCPKLTYLKLIDQQVREPDQINEILTRELKHLEILKIDLETPQVSSKVVDSIANNCKKLKILELGRNEMKHFPEWKKRQLFTVIETLRVIRSLYWDPMPSTRITFLEHTLAHPC